MISGRLRVVIDDEEFHVDAGGTIFTPAGAVHTYVVESDEAHVVGVGTSGGRFHQLQTQASPLLLAEGGPDMAAVGALAATLDIELLGPPIGV